MRAFPRIVILAVAVALVASTLLVGPALAAKGGNGGHGGSSTATAATLSCPDAPQYSTVHCTGTGFAPAIGAYIVITNPDGSTTSGGAATLWNGTIYFGAPTYGSGLYTVDAYQDLGGKQLTWLASTTFHAY